MRTESEAAGAGPAEPPVRIGLLGHGRMGSHHARILAALPGAALSAVYDPDPARADAAARAGYPVAASAEAVFAESEAVVVAAPTARHYDLARAALAAGCHVLVEKPIAARHEEAADLVEAARAARRILAAGHVERYNGAVLAARELVSAPRFVEVHRLSPFPERSLDVDVVLDVMIHDIDIVLSLVGRPVRKVDALGAPVLTDKPDIANARLVFEGGCVANLTASRVSVKRMRKIRIFEEDKYLSLDYEKQDLVLYRRKGPPSPEPKMSDIERVRPKIRKTDPLREELAAFCRRVAAARTGASDAPEPIVGGEEATSALEVAVWIGRAIRGGAGE